MAEEGQVHHHKALGHLAKQPITDIVKFGIGRLVSLRLPWLLLGLVGGMIATLILCFFCYDPHFCGANRRELWDGSGGRRGSGYDDSPRNPEISNLFRACGDSY